MRTHISLHHILLVAFAIGMACTSWGRSFKGRYKSIRVDGNLRDWHNRDMMYPDGQITDGLPLNSTFSTIYVANDDENLYVGLDPKAPSTISSNWTHNLYIDSDMDGSTGFNGGWMTGGYDHLVQYGGAGAVYSIYRFEGDDRAAWSWKYLGEIRHAHDRRGIEWAIPLKHLGDIREMRLEFHTLGPDVETETWAHSAETMAGSYAVARPGN